MTIARIDSGPRMSQAVVAGNLVFTAGRVAHETAGRDVGSQTREILDGIDALLAQAPAPTSPASSRSRSGSPTSATSTR